MADSFKITSPTQAAALALLYSQLINGDAEQQALAEELMALIKEYAEFFFSEDNGIQFRSFEELKNYVKNISISGANVGYAPTEDGEVQWNTWAADLLGIDATATDITQLAGQVSAMNTTLTQLNSTVSTLGDRVTALESA